MGNLLMAAAIMLLTICLYGNLVVPVAEYMAQPGEGVLSILIILSASATFLASGGFSWLKARAKDWLGVMPDPYPQGREYVTTQKNHPSRR